MLDLSLDSFTLQRQAEKTREVIAARRLEGLCCTRSERELKELEDEIAARVWNVRRARTICH